MPLRHTYKIISLDLKGINKELILQIAIKAINDFTGPDRLIPILLVFGTYPQITNNSPPFPSIV